MAIYKNNRKGFIVNDVTVTIFVSIMIFSLLLATLRTTGRFNRVQLARYECISAARAQLDDISAGGEGLNEDVIERLWPGIQLETSFVEGIEKWQGLTLVTVTAKGRSDSLHTTEVLSRYIKMTDGKEYNDHDQKK
jgi:hypothetical protein